jgi:hypothetical protein
MTHSASCRPHQRDASRTPFPQHHISAAAAEQPAYTWRRGKLGEGTNTTSLLSRPLFGKQTWRRASSCSGGSSRPAVFPAPTVARGCSAVLSRQQGIDRSAATRTGRKSRRTPGSRFVPFPAVSSSAPITKLKNTVP